MSARANDKDEQRRSAAPLEDARAINARLDRTQARIMRRWAEDLKRAQAAGDWRAVALVVTGLEVSALVLEDGAGDAAALSASLERLKGGT